MTRKLTLLSICLSVVMLSSCRAAHNQVTPDATQQPAKAAAATTKNRSLQPFSVIEGTSHRVAEVVEYPANRDREGGRFFSIASSSKDYGVTKRNYIFFNTDTKASVKLLPKSNSVFLRLEKVGKVNPKGQLQKVEALWYQVINSDTNGDQIIDARDKSTIAASTVSGEGYTELIPKLDRVLNTFQSGPAKVLIVYELDDQYFTAELDLANRKLLETKELPNLE